MRTTPADTAGRLVSHQPTPPLVFSGEYQRRLFYENYGHAGTRYKGLFC